MKSLFFMFMAAGTLTLFSACGNADQHKMVKGDSSLPQTHQNNASDTTKWTEITWLNDKYDFGTVPEKGPVEVKFKFKNTGTKDLLILSVEKTCGCTETQKPEGFIKPGEEGFVTAKYNTEGRPGKAVKDIHVVCNTAGSPYTLTFTGEVTPAAPAAKQGG
jgi:hypothetical protein